MHNPLSSNIDSTGKKLFLRMHGLSSVDVPANSTHSFTFVVPYIDCKFTGVEIIGCNDHDTANLRILDSSTGKLTGVANTQLNQFGFNVSLTGGKDRFAGEYPSTLQQDLQIEIEYTNNSSSSSKISVNFRLHELK